MSGMQFYEKIDSAVGFFISSFIFLMVIFIIWEFVRAASATPPPPSSTNLKFPATHPPPSCRYSLTTSPLHEGYLWGLRE